MMKILHVLLLTLLTAVFFNTSTFAQVIKERSSRVYSEVNNPNYSEKLNVIWESTFDTPSEWVLDHDTADCSLDWKIGNDTCQGPFYIDTIRSITANNGWALLDSDAYGASNGGTDVEDAWLTTANGVDLTATPNVIVEFETYYKRYNYERPYLVVGIGDGSGNVVWPDLNPDSDISSMNNVFEIFPNMSDASSTANPEKIRININAALTGPIDEVFFRFNWTGTWGYAWFVDDFKLLQQATDDIVISKSYLVNENKNNIQYAQIPIDMVENNWIIGTDVQNYGSQDQTNVVLTYDFTSFNANDSRPLIEVDSVYFMGAIGPQSLSVGLYQGAITVVSDNETAGPEFVNNTGLRNLEITDSLYAVDGIGIHPGSELTLGSMGTTTIPNAADGITLGTLYKIKNLSTISGLRVMLAPGSEEGGQVFGQIYDSLTFWSGVPSALYTSEAAYIGSNDLLNGYIDTYFSNPIQLDTGSYYGAVRLFSNENSNNVFVYDDLTVNQPNYTSGIQNHNVAYTNGNAYAIRLLMNGGWLGQTDLEMDVVKIYPNPTKGKLSILTDSNQENTLVVTDLKGQIIHSESFYKTTALNLESQQAGFYFIEVTNSNSKIIKKVILK